MNRPEPRQEVLVGLIERVAFHNAENGFCILRVKARGHRELVTLVGHAAAILAGEWRRTAGTVAPGTSDHAEITYWQGQHWRIARPGRP